VLSSSKLKPRMKKFSDIKQDFLIDKILQDKGIPDLDGKA